jgi:hypothetical protein
MRYRRRFAIESLESRNAPSSLTLASRVLASSVVVRSSTDPNQVHSAGILSIRGVTDPNI